MPKGSNGPALAISSEEAIKREMVGLIITGILAALAFLCVSDGIPDLARRRGTAHRASRMR